LTISSKRWLRGLADADVRFDRGVPVFPLLALLPLSIDDVNASPVKSHGRVGLLDGNGCSGDGMRAQHAN
jgi:hypothetical protein